MRCSPYVRAQQTAALALQAAGQTPPTRLDERLRDRELGILDRLTGRGIRARFPEEAERRRHLGKFYYRPPGGESWADLALRLRPVLDELSSAPDDGPLLIVCHDAVIFLLRYLLEGLTEQDVLGIAAGESLGNCAVTTYRRADAARGVAARPGSTTRTTSSPPASKPTTHPGERDDAHPR